MFVRNGIGCRANFRPIPTLYARAFTTSDDHSKDYLSWDTDGIPFLIDNSVNAIISSQRGLFRVVLIPTPVNLETSEGLTTTTKLLGSMKLILTDNANKHQSYTVSRFVFDTKTLVYIFSVPYLGTFFCDIADATDNLAEDRTTIK